MVDAEVEINTDSVNRNLLEELENSFRIIHENLSRKT
jgi:hypothetical protein